MIYVPNTQSNKKLLDYMFSLGEPDGEYYKSWNSAVEGDKNMRKHALAFHWTFAAHDIVAAKVKKRFGKALEAGEINAEF